MAKKSTSIEGRGVLLMIETVSISIAFAAGLLFFFSPCVWPMYPAYISYIAGSSIGDVKDGLNKTKVMVNALGFVAGFTLVFVLLGATATGIGEFLDERQNYFRVGAGILIILFGLQLGGFYRLPFLNKEKKINFIPQNPGFFSSAVFGTTFAFAWSPCTTAILFSILLYASQSDTVYQGMVLLAIFSMGFSIPFLLLAYFMRLLHPRLSKFSKYLPLLNKIGGSLLIVIGFLVLFDKFADISLWLFNLVN